MENIKEKIESIRAACIKANPQILELGFGCEVEFEEKIYTIFREYMEKEFVATNKKWNEIDVSGNSKLFGVEILGRPIRLADVMYAICHSQKTRQAMLWGVSGVPYWWDRERLTDTGVAWNLLKDDLRDQSPETIDFIHSLLK